MATVPHTFDGRSAARIAAATRLVENMAPGNPYRQRRRFGGGASLPHPFEIVRVSDTVVKVRAGYWLRLVLGTFEDVKMEVDGSSLPISGDLNDFFTLTGIGATFFITITLDDEWLPTRAIISISGTYVYNKDTRTIGQVVWDTPNSQIGRIDQYEHSHINDEYEVYDGYSLSHRTVVDADQNKTQIWEWDVAVNGPQMPTNSLMIYHDDVTDVLYYCDQGNLANWLAAYFGNNPGTLQGYWSDLLDTDGNPLLVGNIGFVPIVTDIDPGPGVSPRLKLVNGGPGGVGPWWKLGNTSSTDAHGSMVGRSPTVKAIDLSNMRLHYAGLDVDVTQWTVDWDATQLKSPVAGFWDVLNGTYLKVSDVTVAASGDGALEIPVGGAYLGGGLYSDKGGSAQAGYFDDSLNWGQLSDGLRSAAFGNASSNAAICDATAAGTFSWGSFIGYSGLPDKAGSFTDGTRTTNLADGTYALDAVGNVNIGTGDSFMVNTTQVLTDQQAAIADLATPPGSARDSTCRIKVNDILAMLRVHGIIAV